MSHLGLRGGVSGLVGHMPCMLVSNPTPIAHHLIQVFTTSLDVYSALGIKPRVSYLLSKILPPSIKLHPEIPAVCFVLETGSYCVALTDLELAV